MPMALFDAVSGALTAKIVPLHHTGVTATFADGSNIDRYNILKDIDGQLLSDGVPIGGNTEFFDEFLRFAICFGGEIISCGCPLFSAFAFDCRNVSALRF
jgi:hypothetical protein